MWSVCGAGWLDPSLQSGTSPKGLPALEIPGGWLRHVPCPSAVLFPLCPVFWPTTQNLLKLNLKLERAMWAEMAG